MNTAAHTTNTTDTRWNATQLDPSQIDSAEPDAARQRLLAARVTDLDVEKAWENVGTIVWVLHVAMRKVTARADSEGPGSAARSLGMGIYLAGAEASALMPERRDIPEMPQIPGLPAWTEKDLEPYSALRLLTAAEEITRSIPIHHPELVGVSGLVIRLCDLIREARTLDW